VPQSATVTIARLITVAAGVFAPGHLGELTRYVPFELVDDVLAQTGAVQRRLRQLPSRVGVYFLPALGLFPKLGYARVWDKLVAGLDGLSVPRPSEKALRELRRRLGPAPLKALFEVLAGPLAQPRTPGTCFAGMRTVAFDGLNSLKVPDTDRNCGWMGRIRYRMGFAGYPTLRLMCLAETGTRGLLGATIGAAGDRDEATLALRLLPLLRSGILVLLDRGFDAVSFLTAVHRTGAMLLARVRSQRVPPILKHLPDGSYLSDLDGLAVRIIEADVTMRGADGTRVGDRYRLITTLLGHHRYPADALIRLYHERWKIESAFLALRHTMLDGHVLRSGDRAGLEQEEWALLTLYQLLRMAMVDAVETRPSTNPDRASFTRGTDGRRRNRHPRAHPAPRPDTPTSTCPAPTPRSPAADAPRAGHRAAGQRTPPRLDWRRARRATADPEAQHGHPTRRVDPPRVHSPHRRRQLRPRPTTTRPTPGPYPIRSAGGAGQGGALTAQRGQTTSRRDQNRRLGKRHADPGCLLDLITKPLTPRHCCATGLRPALDPGASAASPPAARRAGPAVPPAPAARRSTPRSPRSLQIRSLRFQGIASGRPGALRRRRRCRSSPREQHARSSRSDLRPRQNQGVDRDAMAADRNPRTMQMAERLRVACLGDLRAGRSAASPVGIGSSAGCCSSTSRGHEQKGVVSVQVTVNSANMPRAAWGGPVPSAVGVDPCATGHATPYRPGMRLINSVWAPPGLVLISSTEVSTTSLC
jgi:hypothetical protein